MQRSLPCLPKACNFFVIKSVLCMRIPLPTYLPFKGKLWHGRTIASLTPITYMTFSDQQGAVQNMVGIPTCWGRQLGGGCWLQPIPHRQWSAAGRPWFCLSLYLHWTFLCSVLYTFVCNAISVINFYFKKSLKILLLISGLSAK